MLKETFYFSHDYNTRTDIKIKKLIRKYGMSGYGIWWAIVEDLYNNANALPFDCESIAEDLRTDKKIVEGVITEFELFVVKDGIFGSTSIQERLDKRNEKSKKARDSAYHRWGKEIKSQVEECEIETNDEIKKIFAIWGKPNPSPGESMLIENLLKTFTIEQIRFAFYKSTAQGKQTLAYVKGILKNNGHTKEEKTFTPTSETMKDILSGKIKEHTK